MVPYHIGAKAIAARLGYKSTHVIHKLIIREGLPCYKRIVKNANGTGSYRALAISESALTAWELAKGQQFVAQRRAIAAAHRSDKRYALVG